MSDEETKEKAEAMLVKMAEDELNKKKVMREQFQSRKKDAISQMKQFQDEVKKMERLKEELMRQNAQTEEEYREKKGGKENKHQDKEIKSLTIDKERLYESFLNSNFYEFGKIRTVFELKEKERVERINKEQFDSSYALEAKKSVKQQVEGDYAKPNKPVVSITYMKPNWMRDNLDRKDNLPGNENGAGTTHPPLVSEALGEEDENVTQADIKSSNTNISGLSKYITTFRVARDTKIDDLVRKSTAFWGLRGRVAFLDFEKQEILARNKSVTFETETKQPSFYIYNSMIGIEKFLNAEDDPTKKDEVGVDEKGSDDFESLFMKYLYQLKTFFVIEPPNKAKAEKEAKTKMNDYHPAFIMTIIFLVLFSAFSILMFYAKNESTMKSGFANILTKYRTKTIYYIQDFSSLIDYIDYLGSDEFRQNILKNFQFIGMLTVRQVRTKQRVCDMHGYRSDRVCYELEYSDTTKFYAPISFKYSNGTTDYFYYTTQEQTRIYNKAQGLFSQYDGSGYYVAFDHNYPDFLTTQLAKFDASKDNFIQENTRAVIVDFNLYYPVMNVNVTSQILFEISPMGDVVVNKIKNDLFVLDYSNNRFALYLIDIGLHIFNFIFLFLFVMIIMNLQRDQFLDYCMSKEGLTNWIFAIVSLMALIVFILMLNNSSEILDKRRSSQDYIFYFNDFASYITYYRLYKMLKAIAICVQLIRFSFLISQSRRGRMFIVAVKNIGDKFIFVLLVNFGVLAAFTVMYTYGVGMYFQLMNTITKSFVVVFNMTLRNSLFDDLTIFDGFTFILFIASYLMLISIVGVFLQVIFTDAVRNVFIEYDNHVLHSDSLTLAQRIQLTKAALVKAYQSVKAFISEQLEKMKSNRVDSETSSVKQPDA